MKQSANTVSIVAAMAGIYAVRMLGLFMLFPVLGLYMDNLVGANALSVGIALGGYGLMQGALQIPFALWSGRLGRRNVLLIGLALFILGSVVAMLAQSIVGIIVGRLLQGTGAVAGVLLAALGDWVPERSRVRANAAVGASIGLAFVVALLCAPIINEYWGLKGIFAVNGISGLAALALAAFCLPADSTGAQPAKKDPAQQSTLLTVADLCLGVFVLHAILTASFLVIPNMLVEVADLAPAAHWYAYLIMLGIAAFLALPLLRYRYQGRAAPFVMAVSYLMVAGYVSAGADAQMVLLFGLGMFFAGFGVLESLLPAALIRRAGEAQRATASGYYSTAQFAGAFAGGLFGGVLLSYWQGETLLRAIPILMLLWMLVFIGTRRYKTS